MIADRIEREILIDAPPETVWDVLTQPHHINSWFADAVEIAPQPGGDGVLTWIQEGANEHTTVALRVVRADRPHFFSFRWNFPAGEEPTSRNASLVEFMLTAEGESTRLRLVESGINELDRSDQDKATYADEHRQGWDVILPKLVTYAPTQRPTPAKP